MKQTGHKAIGSGGDCGKLERAHPVEKGRMTPFQLLLSCGTLDLEWPDLMGVFFLRDTRNPDFLVKFPHEMTLMLSSGLRKHVCG